METSLITNATSSVQAARDSSSSVISSDFEMFLQMLTTQMQNQDPLNPIESSDYAVQLATFSSVEQQVLTNDLLTQLSTQMSTSGLAEMATLVGKEARAATAVHFDGSPITIAPNPAAIADQVQLVVYDESGTVISTEDIALSADPIEWAGTDEDGAPLPDGIYRFEVVSLSNGEELVRETAEVYAPIQEVRARGTETYLVLPGDLQINSNQVTALRQGE